MAMMLNGIMRTYKTETKRCRCLTRAMRCFMVCDELYGSINGADAIRKSPMRDEVHRSANRRKYNRCGEVPNPENLNESPQRKRIYRDRRAIYQYVHHKGFVF